jgi:hypothetical protein
LTSFLFCLSRFKCFDPDEPSPYPHDAAVDHENRVALIFTQSLMKIICKNLYRKGVMSLFETDEDTLPLYYGYKMHIALKDIFTEKISRFIETGIITNQLKYYSLENFRSKPEEIGPQVLTLTHLRAGFILILVLLGLSFFIFMVECGPMLAIKLFDLWLYLWLPRYIVVKFTKMNKML